MPQLVTARRLLQIVFGLRPAALGVSAPGPGGTLSCSHLGGSRTSGPPRCLPQLGTCPSVHRQHCSAQGLQAQVCLFPQVVTLMSPQGPPQHGAPGTDAEQRCFIGRWLLPQGKAHPLCGAGGAAAALWGSEHKQALPGGRWGLGWARECLQAGLGRAAAGAPRAPWCCPSLSCAQPWDPPTPGFACSEQPRCDSKLQQHCWVLLVVTTVTRRWARGSQGLAAVARGCRAHPTHPWAQLHTGKQVAQS